MSTLFLNSKLQEYNFFSVQTNCHSATKLMACKLKKHFLPLYKTRMSRFFKFNTEFSASI